MSINIHYVYAGVLGWSALSLLAMAFIRGSDERRQDSPKGSARLGVER